MFALNLRKENVSSTNKSAKSPFILLAMIGILIIATLVVATTYFLQPRIETELRQQLLINFSQAGLTETFVDVSGRDVTLNGVVNNQAEAIKAENTAKQTQGVHQVNNRLLVKNQSSE